jgi:hypothetical protein
MSEEKVVLDSGKYEFYMDGHTLKCKRYGENWREFSGDKAVLSLFYKCLNLQNEIERIKGKNQNIESRCICKGFYRPLHCPVHGFNTIILEGGDENESD